MVIKTRPFDSISDSGFIIDSMAKELYKDKYPDAKRYQKKWFQETHSKIVELVKECEIHVACSIDDENMLLGYAVQTRNFIVFTYVKENYRKQGIAKLLLGDLSIDLNSHYMTKLGRQLVEQFKTKEASLTNQGTPEELSKKNLEKLIKTGFPIKVAKFDPALVSGHGTAENEFNKTSANIHKVPNEMYMTSAGVIIIQNGKTFGGSCYSWAM